MPPVSLQPFVPTLLFLPRPQVTRNIFLRPDMAICHALIISCIMLLLPSFSLAVSPVLVGLNDHFLWRGNADQAVAVSWVNNSNAKIIRSDVNWASLEPTKGNKEGNSKFYHFKAISAR